ncbi:MAG: 2Fe-2S iron-sulfur cluster binding domain-containing protein [Burkholderiaceae bacterium]|nr:2Fe-2S iron-sulfur cluster binding domain-containing protein [Burkholderiaceae bacterium]
MPQATYVSHSGESTTYEVANGTSLMTAAVMGGHDGIEGMCGGCLSCASCHVYVDETWLEKLEPPQADELAMLEMVASERRANSRLSCQILMAPALDGIVVHTPATQS